ncbi:MAG: hypothetical protein ACE5Q6_08560 [Dehalococcoidia bacterium]
MDPKYISEVWQAMSILSDAQEFLGDESFSDLDPDARIARSNERIDHAKRHLTRALEWSSREDQHAFVQGTRLMECTLHNDGDNGTDQALQDR